MSGRISMDQPSRILIPIRWAIMVGVIGVAGAAHPFAGTPRPTLQQEKSSDSIEVRPAVESDGVLDPIALSRPFEPKVNCTSQRKGTTAQQLLQPGLTSVVIHRYDKQAWPDIAAVEGYLRRILQAVPEGDAPQDQIYWSESRPAEIEGTLRFATGSVRRIAAANGYLHFEDQSGCQWWGRFLGPDRNRWIVRE